MLDLVADDVDDGQNDIGKDGKGNYAAEQRSQGQEIGKGKKNDGVRQVGQYGMLTGTQGGSRRVGR